jgi:hypothetical protein
MKMLGIYHVALLPSADENAFVSHMREEVFGSNVLQLTRVTSGFSHQLLERPGELRQYAWHVTVTLVSASYDFDQNVERLQASIEKLGLVIGVDTYTVIAEPEDDSA